MAITWESQQTGIWSVVSGNAASPWYDGGAQTALNTIPVNTDTVNINSPHVVTFDVDMTGWANGVTLTIDAGATLKAKDDAGDYVLMGQADITLNGTIQAGTSSAVPLTGSFKIDFNSTASSVIGSATGHLYLYCIEPETKFVKLTAQEAIGQTELSVDTDVTADIWAVGDRVEISEGATYNDTESSTIAAGGIAAAAITVDDALTAQKEIDSFITLITRNICIVNSTTYAIEDICNSTINCAIYDCTHGIDGSTTGNNTIGGSIKVNEASGEPLKFIYGSTVNAAIAGSRYGISYCYDSEFSADAVMAGCYYPCVNSRNLVLRGNWSGGKYFVWDCSSIVFAADHAKGYSTAIYKVSDIILQDMTFDTGLQVTSSVSDLRASGCTFQNNTRDLSDETTNGTCYNCTFTSAIEFNSYNDKNGRGKWDYVESFDHDGVTNAYKAWPLGGIVTSATADPPTGYTIYYSHACESATYPCFRQYEATVLPGTAIEVSAQIRLADGDDHTAFPPALQIMDAFADGLVDSSQTPLDEDEVAVPNGTTNHAWQAVDCIWANTGDAPRQVIVRLIAQHATGVVEEAWKACDYQTKISDILKKIKRFGPGGEIV